MNGICSFVKQFVDLKYAKSMALVRPEPELNLSLRMRILMLDQSFASLFLSNSDFPGPLLSRPMHVLQGYWPFHWFLQRRSNWLNCSSRDAVRLCLGTKFTHRLPNCLLGTGSGAPVVTVSRIYKTLY